MNVCLYTRMCVCVHALTWETCYLRSKRNNERHDINPLKTQDISSICLPHQPSSQVNYLDLVVNLSIFLTRDTLVPKQSTAFTYF